MSTIPRSRHAKWTARASSTPFVVAPEPPVLIAELHQRGPERIGRDEHACLPRDWLDHHAGDPVRGDKVREDLLPEVIDHAHTVALRRVAVERTAVRVRIRHVD